MALVKCHECGKKISDTAKQCPNCGYERQKTESDSSDTVSFLWKIVSILIALLFAVLCVAVIGWLILNVNTLSSSLFVVLFASSGLMACLWLDIAYRIYRGKKTCILLAAILSAFIPGLGQFVFGDRIRAVKIFFLYIILGIIPLVIAASSNYFSDVGCAFSLGSSDDVETYCAERTLFPFSLIREVCSNLALLIFVLGIPIIVYDAYSKD